MAKVWSLMVGYRIKMLYMAFSYDEKPIILVHILLLSSLYSLGFKYHLFVLNSNVTPWLAS